MMGMGARRVESPTGGGLPRPGTGAIKGRDWRNCGANGF